VKRDLDGTMIENNDEYIRKWLFMYRKKALETQINTEYRTKQKDEKSSLLALGQHHQ
jgi:hypothetical protein